MANMEKYKKILREAAASGKKNKEKNFEEVLKETMEEGENNKEKIKETVKEEMDKRTNSISGSFNLNTDQNKTNVEFNIDENMGNKTNGEDFIRKTEGEGFYNKIDKFDNVTKEVGNASEEATKKAMKNADGAAESIMKKLSRNKGKIGLGVAAAMGVAWGVGKLNNSAEEERMRKLQTVQAMNNISKR